MPLRAAVIGCGAIAPFHFPALRKAGAQVTWVCDLSPAAAAPHAERLGARATTDYRDALADAAVDVVDVTTVTSAHKAICLDAIGAGKAVICEKTLAENPDDALAIVRAAEAAGTILYTSYMKRFIPAVEQAKALLPSLGRILTAHVRSHQCWGEVWGEAPREGLFHTPAGGASGVRQRYGGGALLCAGSHMLDLVNFLLGRPRRLAARVHTPPARDYDLLAAALLATDAAPVHFEALAHPLGSIGFLRDGWDERVEITGTRGRLEILSARWDTPATKSSVLLHHDAAAGDGPREYRYPPASPFDGAMAVYCANIERGEQGEPSRLAGYEVDELIAAIRRSAATGQAVDVNWRA